MKQALRALVTGLIDYAGLFPPASLSMEDALRKYGAYRRGPYAWMLGGFVVPAARLHEVPRDFPVSVLADASLQFEREVQALEVKYAGPAFSRLVAPHPDPLPEDDSDTRGMVVGRGEKPGAPVYVEIPVIDDPASLLAEIRAAGARAKIRTGGITVDAFPDAAQIARFIERCRQQQVTFKATAGLHHPLRCVKPLTYEADAPHGTMHGFLNVFIAALFPDAALEILLEDDPRAFTFDDEALTWRDRRATVAEIETMRRDVATSFGSCSFEEPVDDLRELGLLV
jgi:hypothetical protein